MSLEYQRYGRNKETLVNSTYIDSGEYRHKFDKITDNINVNRVLYSRAKEMLKHRSGTKIEDMYWIDGKIFQYTSDKEISERLYEIYIQRYIAKGFSDYEAQLKTLEKLKENYKIDFWEVT